MQFLLRVDEERNDPDLLRIPAIIYLVGTLSIIALAYVLPGYLAIYVVIGLAVWGVAVPVYMYILYLRNRQG